MRRALALAFLLLALGCQPYLDHELPVYNFSKDFVDFGHKRRLRVLSIEADQESLLVVFNQPLRLLGDSTKKLPFEARILPRLPIKEVELEGLAGVRYRFARPAPAAQQYSLVIPAGWRALSGASYLSETTHPWNTPRPELLSWEPGPGSRTGEAMRLDSASTALLRWNQSVQEESLRKCLELRPVGGEEPIPFELTALGETQSHYEVRFGELESGRNYRLVLSPGVKGVEGQLTSEQALERCVVTDLELKLVSPTNLSLDHTNRARLVFSDPVAQSELRRMLWCPGGAEVEIEGGAYEREYRLIVDPDLDSLTLLAGLRSLNGSELSRDLVLSLNRRTTSETEAVPLTPVPLAPGSVSFPQLAQAGGRTVTWGLTLPQALAVSRLPESQWSAGKKLSWEYGKPAFQTPKKKEKKPTDSEADKPEKPEKPKGPPPHELFLAAGSKNRFGFFLTRRSHKGKLARSLLVRTDLELRYLVEPGAVQVLGRSRRLERPRAGAIAELFDHRGRVLAKQRLNSEGTTRFELGRSQQPFAVGLRWGKDRTFLPLQGLKPPVPEPPALLSALDRLHYQPDQGAVLYGFVVPAVKWAEAERLSFRILGPDGKEVQPARPVPVSPWGLFEAHFFTPNREGLYRLELEQTREGEPPRRQQQKLRVGKQLRSHEEYRIDLAEESLSTEVVSGSLVMNGPRHDELVLRALLRPEPGRAELNGWRAVEPPTPRWQELTVNLDRATDTFQVPLPPDRSGSPVLQLELFEPAPDGGEWELVERQRELPLSGPQLVLSAEGPPRDLGTSHLIKLQLEGTQEEPELLEARLFYRALESEESDWQELGLHQFGQEQEPWPVGFSRAGHYRLDGIATGETLGLILRSWSTTVEEPLEEQQFELTLEPSLAAPGETVTPVLRGLAPGVRVGLELFGGRHHWAREEAVPVAGRLSSFEVPQARSEELTLFARILPEPTVGVQRVSPLVSEASLKLDPTSRQRGLELRLPDTISAQEAFQVALVPTEEGPPIRGFLVSREKMSLYEADHLSLYRWLTRQRQPLPVRSEAETQLSLARSVQNNFFRGGLVVEGGTVLPQQAPSEPGHYHWDFLGWDQSGRVCQASASLEVTPASQWRPLTPSAVRQSDAFDAGLKFEAASDELTPLGLTASISEHGSLEPSSYFQTSALVEPGSADELIFHYLLPEGAREEVELHWNLGLEGRRHEQWAEVPVIPVPTIGRTLRRGRLGAEGRIRMDVDLVPEWALWIRWVEGEEARIEVRHPGGTHGATILSQARPQRRITGKGPGVVELLHQEGSAVDYVLEELVPDDGASRSSGSQLYLMRSIEDGEGQPVNPDRMRRGSRYDMVLHVLNPTPQADVLCRIPLPGGAVPERVLGEEYHPDWEWSSGELQFSEAYLPVGEFTWRVRFRAESSGEYLWPFSEILDNEGHVLAHSGSGRVRITD